METSAPKMTIGKYSGVRIDAIPNSYLRWMITQDFPKDLIKCAMEKLSKSSYTDTQMHISRHAIDMFSKRFLNIWAQSEADKGDDALGLASFMVRLAQEAWDSGEDVSKRRHMNDGIIKQFNGIKWVFNFVPEYPDYKDIITVMDGTTE